VAADRRDRPGTPLGVLAARQSGHPAGLEATLERDALAVAEEA